MSEFIAHKHIRQKLSKDVSKGRLGHAYIFEGPKGVGKATAALWFAKISMCSNNIGVGCDFCENCIKIKSRSHPDITFADEDYFGNTKIRPGSVESARIIKENVYKKPFMAKRSFVILPDGDALTTQAQNALLKVFEEPPKYCTFIILCSSSMQLLETIRSRAVSVRFSPISDEDIAEYIKVRYGQTADTGLLSLAGGLMGKADALMDSPEFSEEYNHITSAFARYIASSGDMTEISAIITRDNIQDALKFLEGWALEKTRPSGNDDETLSYVRILEILQNTQLRLKKNINFNLAVTDMLIKSWEATHG